MKVEELFEGEKYSRKFNRHGLTSDDMQTERDKDMKISQALENEKIKFLKDPKSWDDIKKYKKLPVAVLDNIEKSLKKDGIQIPTFKFEDLYFVANGEIPKSPHENTKISSLWARKYFILGKRNKKEFYLCYQPDENDAYIKNWIRIG